MTLEVANQFGQLLKANVVCKVTRTRCNVVVAVGSTEHTYPHGYGNDNQYILKMLGDLNLVVLRVVSL